MHGCLRAVLNQVWKLVGTIPAQGVRLPRKKARKPSCCTRKARYSPCDLGIARTDEIRGCGFAADRRGHNLTLGKNSLGSNRNRGASLRRRIQ